MEEKKTTNQLQAILSKTSPEDFQKYLKENGSSIMGEDEGSLFIKQKLKEKNISQKDLFARAGIPERYGYKLLQGEKKTKVRDVIFRMCICAGFSLRDTQTVLSSLALPALYPKRERDAAIIIAINRHFGNVEKTNELLEQNGLEGLQECGMREEEQ